MDGRKRFMAATILFAFGMLVMSFMALTEDGPQHYSNFGYSKQNRNYSSPRKEVEPERWPSIKSGYKTPDEPSQRFIKFPADNAVASSSAPMAPSLTSFKNSDIILQREEIHDLLNSALQDDYAALELTDDDIETLTDAVLDIRESMEGLRRLIRDEQNFMIFKQLEDQRQQAVMTFELVTGMSVLEFMRKAPGEGEIDWD